MTVRAKSVLTIALGLGLLYVSTSNVAGDDAKTPMPPAKAPDFTKAGYVYAKDVTGEVVSADDSKVTIKVTYAVAGKSPRPGVPGKAMPMTKEMDYKFISDMSLVRFQGKSLLPKKTDDKGKKVDYTQKELDALKKPTGVTGYAATTSDLTKGTIVSLTLVVEKSNTMPKEEDLKVKTAVITQLPVAAPPKQ